MGNFKIETKTLNKSATVQNILDKANLPGNGISIDIEGFNKKVYDNDDAFLIEAAEFLKVEVVYN